MTRIMQLGLCQVTRIICRRGLCQHRKVTQIMQTRIVPGDSDHRARLLGSLCRVTRIIVPGDSDYTQA